jgi:hypothetical protein
MNIRIVTHTLPAQYASYLVNGDRSIFNPAINPDGKKEWQEFDQWCSKNGIVTGHITVADGVNGESMEPYFMHGPIGPQEKGGDALDFDFHYEEFEDHE